jgi:hypothetical protein
VGAIIGAVLTGASALVAAGTGLRASGNRRAMLLAVAAGLADACSAVVIMQFSQIASHGMVAILTSWTTYAVAVCGMGNVLLTQSAYQTARPMVTLPIIAAVTPAASAAVGILLLGETPRLGAIGAVAAGVAVLVASLALGWLARSVPHPEMPEPAGLALEIPTVLTGVPEQCTERVRRPLATHGAPRQAA